MAEPWPPVEVASLVQDSVEVHTVVEVYLPNHDAAQQSGHLLEDVFQPEKTKYPMLTQQKQTTTCTIHVAL